jgi:hypothetical protein
MRHTGRHLTSSTAGQSSFAPAANGGPSEHLFERPRWVRPNTPRASVLSGFGQYVTSRAVLAGGCTAIGDGAVGTFGRARRRAD